MAGNEAEDLPAEIAETDAVEVAADEEVNIIPMEGGKIYRYYCGCDAKGSPCKERGGYQYIIVKNENDSVVSIPFHGQEVRQRGKKFYMGSLAANLIDVCSSVPQIEDHRLPSEISESLENREEYDNFQRKLIDGRPEEMGKFWRDFDNNLVNAVCLGIESDSDKNHHSVKISNFESAEVPKEFVKFEIFAHVPEGRQEPESEKGWFDSECSTCGKTVRDFLKYINTDNKVHFPKWNADRKASVQRLLTSANIVVNGDGKTAGMRLLSDYCLDPTCPGHGNGGKGIISGRNRPLLALDGQHRIRGTQSGESMKTEWPDKFWLNSGHKVSCPRDIPAHMMDIDSCDCDVNGDFSKPTTMHDIPFTILPSDFDRKEQGKLFTDITTEAKPLSPNHQLYMLYRYEMKRYVRFDSSPKEYDFQSNTTTDYKSYVTLLRLTREGIMTNRINPLGGELLQRWSCNIEKAMEMLKSIWSKAFSVYTNNEIGGHLTHAAKSIDKIFTAFSEVMGNVDDTTTPYFSPSIETHGIVSDNNAESLSISARATLAFKGIFLTIPEIFWEAAARKYWRQEGEASYDTFIEMCGGAPDEVNFGDNYDIETSRFNLLSVDGYRPHQIDKDLLKEVFETAKWKFENHTLYGKDMWSTTEDQWAKGYSAEISFMKGIADPERMQPYNILDQEYIKYQNLGVV